MAGKPIPLKRDALVQPRGPSRHAGAYHTCRACPLPASDSVNFLLSFLCVPFVDTRKTPKSNGAALLPVFCLCRDVGCFHFPAMMARAGVNVAESACVKQDVEVSGPRPRGGMAGSYGRPVSFLRILHIDFQRSWTSVQLHSRRTRVLFSLRFLRHSLLVVLLISAVLRHKSSVNLWKKE